MSLIPVAPQPELALEQLREFPNNPRRHWGDMEGLAASVKANGIIEPLVVRALNGHYQIIAGARRFRAAKTVGLATVPVTVREASDAVAIELAILENLQRHDIHPLDEALGIERLMKADKAYTAAAVAAKLGKSERAIKDRLTLLRLIEDVRAAFLEDRITAGHAQIIARLDSALQAKALAECFDNLWRSGAHEKVLNPIHELEEWVRQTVAIEVDAAETAELFPEVATAAAKAAGAGTTLVHLADTWQVPTLKKKGAPAILSNNSWREAKAKEACAVQGVVVLGDRRGQVLTVCVTPKCPTHTQRRPTYESTSTRTTVTPEEKKKAAARRQRELAAAAREKAARERQNIVVVRALVAAVKAVSPTDINPRLGRLVLGEIARGANIVDAAMQRALTEVAGLTLKHYSVSDDQIRTIPDAKIAAAIAFIALAEQSHAGVTSRFAAALAPFKVDLKKLDAQVSAEKKAAAKKAAAPATKKTPKDRKAISDRMKKYWAERSKGAKKGSAR